MATILRPIYEIVSGGIKVADADDIVLGDKPFYLGRKEISDDYTLESFVTFIAVTSLSGSITITVPEEETYIGRTLVVQDESGSANGNNIVIDFAGAVTVNGQGQAVITKNYGRTTLISGLDKWIATGDYSLTVDNDPPIISNANLTITNVQETSFDVGFSKASDVVTLQENLVYELYSSDSNNLNNTANVILNGTLEDSGTDVSQLSASGLPINDTTWVNVLVKDEAGNSNIYTQASQLTPDNTAPTVGDKTLTPASETQSSFIVSFNKATDNATVQGNLIYRLYTSLSNNLITNAATVELNGTLRASGTDVSQLTAGGLAQNTTYYFNVIVIDESNNKTIYTSNTTDTLVSPDTTPPTVGDPVLTTSSITETSFNVDYTEATDDTSAQGNLEYRLYSSNTNNIGTIVNAEANGTLENTGTGVSTLSITGLSVGQTKWFNVIVTDEGGNKSIYTQNFATTVDVTPPVISDSTLTFSNVGPNTIDVDFTKATDNLSVQSNLVYKLYRASSGTDLSNLTNIDSNGTEVASSADVSQLSDSGLSEETTYEYNVTVEDEAGNRGYYTQNSTTTSDATPPVLTSATATSTGETTGSGSVDTDEGQGTLYWVASTNATTPTKTQIMNGNDSTGSAGEDSGNQVVNSTGTQNISLSGLTAGTTFYVFFFQIDEASNQSGIVSDSFSTDALTQPTPTISSTESSPTSVNPIPITIEWDEIVQNFIVTDITIVNGTLQNFVTVDGDTYTVEVVPDSNNENITIDIASAVCTDIDGNNNLAANQFAITYDELGDIPVITSNEPTYTQADPIAFTVTFPEEQIDFVVGDIIVGNGTLSGFVNNNDGTYDVNLNPTSNGPCTIDINTGVCTDQAGNNNQAATQFIIFHDTAAPTASQNTFNAETNLTGTSFTANWVKATDTVSSQANIRYYFYISDTNNIDNLANVLANGTLLNSGGTLDINTYNVTGQTEGETVYYNVLREDQAGNQSVYTMDSVTFSDSTPPNVPNSGLSVKEKYPYSLVIEFLKANDLITAQANLDYKLYISASDNMNSVTNCKNNGILKDQGTDVTELTAYGLDEYTNYYFQVLVSDGSNNESIYTANFDRTGALGDATLELMTI